MSDIVNKPVLNIMYLFIGELTLHTWITTPCSKNTLLFSDGWKLNKNLSCVKQMAC